MRITIIVLNYRTPQCTINAVKSAEASCSGMDFETIIVDNASGDDSVRLLHNEFPTARIVEMPSNQGFSSGMNMGLRQATGDYVLLLNSDIEASPLSVDLLVHFMSAEPEVAIASPVLLDTYGRMSRSILVEPRLWRVFVPTAGKVSYKFWQKRICNKPIDVEATEGAALMVRREVLNKVGLLDEEFFFYHEVVDWCMRMRDHGYRVAIVPGAKMIHMGGQSTSAINVAARIELKRTEYLLLGKRLGAWVRMTAVARDMFSEILRALFYGSGVVLTFGLWARGRDKLMCHASVLRWMIGGMPDRNHPVYLRKFGDWG